jgi:hypothetical protein
MVGELRWAGAEMPITTVNTRRASPDNCFVSMEVPHREPSAGMGLA